jgi:outer membrane protease
VFSFSAAATIGFFYGQSEEIVYKDSSNTYLSELLWDMKPLVHFGADMSFELQIPSWPVGLYADLSVKKGISGFSGFMEDRDWMHPTEDYLTHYSRHNSYTYDSWFFDGDLGVSIPLRRGKTFNPALSVFCRFSCMEMKFVSRDGYTQYGPNNTPIPDDTISWEDSFPKIDSPGEGIRYSQSWIIVSPGIAASFPLSRFFTLDCSFTITPLVFVNTEDLHLSKNMQYIDKPQGGLALEPEIRAFFFLNSSYSLSLRVSWRYMTGARGNSWIKNMDPDSPDSGKVTFGGTSGGAGFNALNTGLSFKIYF